jgi:hypothetical protein
MAIGSWRSGTRGGGKGLHSALCSERTMDHVGPMRGLKNQRSTETAQWTVHPCTLYCAAGASRSYSRVRIEAVHPRPGI